MVTIRHIRHYGNHQYACHLIADRHVSYRGSVLPMGGLIDGKGLGCVSPTLMRKLTSLPRSVSGWTLKLFDIRNSQG